MAYSVDLRRRALELLSDNHSVEEVSSLLNIGTASLWRWKRRDRQGQLEAHYPKSRSPYKVDEARLRAFVADHPDAYQHEIGDALGVSRSGIQVALQRLQITRKKRPRTTENAMKRAGRNMNKT